ncbi:Uncharacterized protein dnm_085160 [Desulfonema magnum]|uniref:Uncharacterized protein n=1 Tax=Desulfonema magnum TaxID=45655 RepID=A0A975BVB7_9BACT|nr:Uncharacterized protein dnm_085160 [Desulfonema magnum]
MIVILQSSSHINIYEKKPGFSPPEMKKNLLKKPGFSVIFSW